MIDTSRRTLLAGGAFAALAHAAGCAHSASPSDPYLDAYYYAFPIYEMARTAWAAAGPTPQRPAHRFNTLQQRRTLTDHTGRNVTTPNNDTVYCSARLDLSNGPVLVSIPTVRDRYFSVAFMNAYTDNFAYVGTRATGGEGGPTLVAGSSWRGEAPAGTRLIRSDTNDVWMLARILVTGVEDLPAANAVQEQIRIIDAPAPTLPPVAPTNADDLENFLAVVNATLARASLADPVGSRARNFADVGLRPGDLDAWRSLNPAQQGRWRQAAAQGQATLRTGFTLRGETLSGWHYPPPGVGSQSGADDVRAAVALSGLAALEAEEATYARADTDSAGAPLNGAHRYTLTIPPNVPASAFWSLSMYQLEPDARLFFTENPINRFSIGDRTPGIARNADGSMTIAIQADAPTDTGNWLPAPRGPFVITFRAYLPQPAMLNHSWRLPAVQRAT
ncbi:DUF1254 domain-containing protein [Terricaulis sp.]|uniref:DUF1254 domain-containing protein n=1 Tax=Terricaulis sp. TaxID=2768686 RepID=UPI002AC67029|nr:DUF1254 domain-containing protein [Terricaulis sp.]MDZ4693343.1 DUF1254 domain-containing protein [Terricaulis sp.]